MKTKKKERPVPCSSDLLKHTENIFYMIASPHLFINKIKKNTVKEVISMDTQFA